MLFFIKNILFYYNWLKLLTEVRRYSPPCNDLLSKKYQAFVLLQDDTASGRDVLFWLPYGFKIRSVCNAALKNIPFPPEKEYCSRHHPIRVVISPVAFYDFKLAP